MGSKTNFHLSFILILVLLCHVCNIQCYFGKHFIHHRLKENNIYKSKPTYLDATYSLSNFKSEDTELVLETVKRTDRGINSTPEIDNLISQWIQLKSDEYKSENKLAKTDLNLFGNYDVTYAGSGKNQTGQPAGGAFRGKIGKKIFTTDKLLQNIIQNENNQTQVVNVVKGRIFSFIPFRVILYGIATFLNDNERSLLYRKYGRNLTESAVRADFEPPLICFGNEWNKLSFSIRIGPKSNVVLDTPYVDQRIRLGVGSRGSLFIFTRTFDMMANEWQIWKEQKKPLSGKSIGKLLLTSGLVIMSLEILKNMSKAVMKTNLFLPGSLLTLFGVYLFTNRGGILRDNNELV